MMRKWMRGPAAVFAEDKGFYIILTLCIAAIAISGYVLFFTPSPAATEPLSTAVVAPTVTPDDLAPVLGSADDIPVTAEEETIPTESPIVPAEPEVTPAVAQPAAPAFVRPVAGEVSVAFSGDEMLYQPTFGDWRVHAGADYATELGARVYAITDGTVLDVVADGLYGTCITLEHADGLQTVYKGLGDKVKVKAEQTVKAGDVLGVVGDGNLAEAGGGTHLHVEATQNGAQIDPETLLTHE